MANRRSARKRPSCSTNYSHLHSQKEKIKEGRKKAVKQRTGKITSCRGSILPNEREKKSAREKKHLTAGDN
jgi:hypothetical protein